MEDLEEVEADAHEHDRDDDAGVECLADDTRDDAGNEKDQDQRIGQQAQAHPQYMESATSFDLVGAELAEPPRRLGGRQSLGAIYRRLVGRSTRCHAWAVRHRHGYAFTANHQPSRSESLASSHPSPLCRACEAGRLIASGLRLSLARSQLFLQCPQISIGALVGALLL